MKSSSTSVLHLVSWYPSKVHPSLGNFVAEHILAIQAKVPGAVLGAFAADANSIDYQIENGVPVCRVYFIKKLAFTSYLNALRKGYEELLSRGFHFDLAHLHVAYPAGLFLLNLKLPYIVTEHFSAYQKNRRKDLSLANRLVAKLIFNKAQFVAPVSDQLGLSLKDFGVKSPQITIGNVVNTNIFHYKTRVESQSFRVLHISSLQESTKNISGIVSAFADFHQKFPLSSLSIGGDGQADELLMHIKNCQIPKEAFRILPALSKEEVAQEMQESDCFLLFSHIENQPVVILESLCIGRPVIGTRVGGIPQLIDKSRGLLIEANNRDQLIEALSEMYHSHQNYEHKKMASIAQNEFGYEAIAEKFSEVYSNVLRLNASGQKDLNLEP